VVLVTGASRGIGAAAARTLAAEGAAVGLIARSRDAIEAIAGEIAAAPAGAPPPCPATWPTGPRSRPPSAEAGRRLGRVDILVANAAVIEPIGPLAELDPEEWARAVSINLLGVFYGIRAVLPGMIAQGGGTLITIGSGAAQNAARGLERLLQYKGSGADARALHASRAEGARHQGVLAVAGHDRH
jgi:NADP-dependent 3-hydroxy acid dehydrogenase YdfG